MRLAALFALIVAATWNLQAEDWPQWRGPLGNGVSTEKNLPERWNTSENVAWRVKLPGVGVSSPVVAGDRVYVTSQVGRGKRREGNHPMFVEGEESATAGERTLAALDTAAGDAIAFVVSAYQTTDGKELWRHEVRAEGELAGVHDKHNLATPSPVTDGQLVFAWFGTGQVVALDRNGKPVWARHLAQEYSPFAINWGHSSSPALYEDLVILLCYHEPASYLLALDKKTGQVRWKKDRASKAHSYSTPMVLTGERGPELVVNTSEGMEGYDPKTGELLWQAPEANRFPIPVPAYHEGTIYATRGYRSGPYAALKLGGRGNVSTSHVAWKVETGAPYVSSLVHLDGLLYMASELGIVTCIDAKTGERVWRERVGGIFTASPVAGDGKIYLVSETGETTVLRGGRRLDIVSRNKLDDYLVASPAIAGGKLFLRGHSHLTAIGR